MSATPPFVDPETALLDFDQIVVEAILLGKLVGLFVALALIPLAIVYLLGTHSGIEFVLTLVAQFILAVGSGIVLIYIISRSIALAGE